MTRDIFKFFTVIVFIVCALGIIVLFIFPAPWSAQSAVDERQARVVIPQQLHGGIDDFFSPAEFMVREELMAARVAFDEGEVVVYVLNGIFDGGQIEQQFVAYRNMRDIDSPIYLAFIDFDFASRSYRRIWSAPTAATRQGTINLFTMDLLGDRSLSVLLSGVNSYGEHTLTVFRKNPAGHDELFSKIAEIVIDGTITVRETERSQAYRMGIAQGASFTIAANGRDPYSANILDQVEIIYAFNPITAFYEERSRTRIPGAQIEQRRVRELLGNRQAFEEFLSGLWFFTTAGGSIVHHQYIFFDPYSREIIFFGDGSQQVFRWHNSVPTRSGLFISGQNISISSLRRSIDIELESLNSISIRVTEGVRVRFAVASPWDGSYRKAAAPALQIRPLPEQINHHINARFDSSIGQILFLPNGIYEINDGRSVQQGNYAFFSLNGQEILELRSSEPRSNSISLPERETFIVESERGNLNLHRVRIGTRGIERLHEAPIMLTLIAE